MGGWASRLKTAELGVRICHSKTKGQKRKSTRVKTAFAGADVGCETPGGSAESAVRFTWGQKFQFVSEKRALGDQLQEKVTFDIVDQSKSGKCVMT